MKLIASWLDWTQIMMELSTTICSFLALEDNLTMPELPALRNVSWNLIQTLPDQLPLLILELHSNVKDTQKFALEKSQKMKPSLSSSLTSVTKTTMARSPWSNGEITTLLFPTALKVMTISNNSWITHGAEHWIDFKHEIF